MIFLTTVTTVKKYLLSPYFWKEQFDTFDNRCDVLRAAFCDSRDVLHMCPKVFNFFSQMWQSQLNLCDCMLVIVFSSNIFHTSSNALASMWFLAIIVTYVYRVSHPSCNPPKTESQAWGEEKNRVQELPPCPGLCFFGGVARRRRHPVVVYVMFVEWSSRHRETHGKKALNLVSPLSITSPIFWGPWFWIPTRVS